MKHRCTPSQLVEKATTSVDKTPKMRSLVLSALFTLTASFASNPSPSPCDLEAMATDASGEYSCGVRIEWLKSKYEVADSWAREQVAQENPNSNPNPNPSPNPLALTPTLTRWRSSSPRSAASAHHPRKRKRRAWSSFVTATSSGTPSSQ